MRPTHLSAPLAVVILLVSSAPIASANPTAPRVSDDRAAPELVMMPFRGISRPVRALPPVDVEGGPKLWLGSLENENDQRGSNLDERGIRYGTGTAKVDDRSVSPSRPTGEPMAPDLILDFDGLSSIISGPPDTEGAVGPDHYVQFVNIQFRIYDKTGAPLTAPAATNSLWAGSGSTCEGDLYADPIVMYDEPADRWVITYIALEIGSGFVACVAVSTSGDPTDEYFLYELETPLIPDYPKLGVWPDPVHNAYVMGTMPIPDPQGKHDVYALDRERLLIGAEPRPAQRFNGFPNMMMPADVDGPAPPPGSPALLYTFRDGGESFFIPPSPVDSLDVYELSIDWDSPAASRLVLAQSLTPPELAEFNWTVCGWNNPDCLSQPQTTQKLDSISWIPMQRLQYRSLGAYETLVGVWTVNAIAVGAHAAPRWFELRRYGGNSWVIAHQGTFAPNSSHRWMASVALDGSGNMAMGYNVMNAGFGIFPSLCYTVRSVDSPDFVDERTLATGTGYQTDINRWGDYASMEVDPTDDCTFWFTGEYMETTGPGTWNTRIGAFRHPDCTAPLIFFDGFESGDTEGWSVAMPE